MKILVCHNYYKNTSGEDLVFTEDVGMLRNRGCEVTEYQRSNTETDSFTRWQRLAFLPNTIYSRKTSREVKGLVAKVKPDVAIVQNVFPLISPSVYYALHEAGVPIVQLVYNYRFVCPNAILYTEGKICERCLHGNFAHAVKHKCFRSSRGLSALYASTLTAHRHIGDLTRLISAYVTPDLFLKEKLVEGGFPGARVFPVLNPFDVTRYTSSASNRNYFAYFGRIVREKGIFTLLNAMKLLPDVRLEIVGGGEATAEAENFASEAGLANVHFRGPVYGEDLVAILRESLAIVVPTEWYDNSPLVIHQAFALGKPVIASDIDGIPEIVKNNETGLLFPPGNVERLAGMITLLQSDEVLRNRLGVNARRKAEAEFTIERRYDSLLRVVQFARENRIKAR